jgi:hypothetical protein
MSPLLVSKEGVKIEIYSRDHLPVHIHAKYGEFEALINIRTDEVLRGSLPPKKLRVVIDWLNEGDRREKLEKMFYELNPRHAPKIEITEEEVIVEQKELEQEKVEQEEIDNEEEE